MITKNKKIKFSLFFFCVFFSFFFFQVKSAHADTYCRCWGDFLSSLTGPTWLYKNITDADTCEKTCKAKMGDDFGSISMEAWEGLTGTTSVKSAGNSAIKAIKNAFYEGVMILLGGLLRLMGMFLGMATSLFSILASAEVTKDLFSNGSLYKSWSTIKDLFNLSFILILLFSAFATIFQVEKYNYKKILLTLIIMALLVNFSYPIARIIIDFSNILMYSIINFIIQVPDGKEAGVIFAGFARASGLGTILDPINYTDISSLIAAIIFVFILAITFLAIGILLLIRLVSLFILVIFSPIGFVGNIIPGMKGIASSWWNQLIKNAFFGPIMFIMIYIAMQIATFTLTKKFTIYKYSEAQTATPQTESIIASWISLIVPIVVLWIGMGIAQKSSIACAGVVMGRAQKIGRSLSGYNFTKNTLDKYKSERKDRKEALGKTKLSNRLGSWGANKANQMGDLRDKGELMFKKNEGDGAIKRTAKFIGRRAPGINPDLAEERTTDLRRKKVQEQLNDWRKQGGIEEDELKKIISDKKKGAAERQAAALELSKEYGFRGDDAFNNFVLAKEVMKNDKALDKTFTDNTKKKRLDIVMSYDIANPGTGKNGMQVAKEKFDSLSVDDFKNINFEALTRQNGGKSTQDTAEQAAREYFESINRSSDERQKDIFKKINAENQAFIEQNIIQQNQGRS